MTVAEHAQKKGLGTSLVSVLLGMMSVMGVPAVCARTRVDVPSATQLLASQGFDCLGRTKSSMHGVVATRYLHRLDLTAGTQHFKPHQYQLNGGDVLRLLARSAQEAEQIFRTLTTLTGRLGIGEESA